ncbi:bacterial Ig-like domain-containing protein [Bifidobacterium sp. CP2]|uniref:bacterial Ig-like domain-containing protein n=1 Tax=Bifidobacterium sp. CP2 TaxID=2809025 RepID=UPI001BDDB105|nr:bacterial Ig-like domain-containing protein [Bifidobacterium sp. CP2]MBT1181360.1 bacterial Ig-like domain-containing protein [Bifidobacterium sp. CP2]
MTQPQPHRAGALLAAIAAAATLLTCGLAATGATAAGVDYLPTIDQVPTYTSFQPTADPGTGSNTYFQPYWYAKNADDNGGTHIQAHGGQVVKVGDAYYWYGEDRSNGYDNSPGVHAYMSKDLYNWTDLGVALKAVTSKAQLTDKTNKDFAYFDKAYHLTKSDGSVDTAKADAIFPYLNTNPDQDGDGVKDSVQAIFERPKIIYNEKNKQYVLWWHSDGSTTPGGSNYARALAGVAVSDNPAGPFTMVGAYRLPNQNNWKQAAGNPDWGENGDSRDMTVFVDPKDRNAYVVYSTEANHSLYVAKLNDDYTNVVKTTTEDQSEGKKQYSADGQYPYILADGKPGAPVRGEDFQIISQNGSLEASAVFQYDGRYNVIASGTTGWSPNKQTYYTASSMLGTWIRGVEKNDANETTWFNSMPEGSDGLLSVNDARGTTFGSQTASVLAVDQAKGHFIYLGDRWDDGKADSTYVWLPLTIGENETIEMHNPAQEDLPNGWGLDYWDNHGGTKGSVVYWKVNDDLPESVSTGGTVTLPAEVDVTEGKASDATTAKTKVTWNVEGGTAVDGKANTYAFNVPGTYTLTGTLAEDANFNPGRTFRRQITVSCSTPVSGAWKEAHWKGGSACKVAASNGAYDFTVTANADRGVWTDRNEGSTVYQPDALETGDTLVTTVKPLDLGGNGDPRAGLIVRNSLGSANGGKGYATLLASPSGIYMQYDSNGDGYIDTETTHVAADNGFDATHSVQLKLERTGADTIKGYWRAGDAAADAAWNDVATVTLTGADATGLDAGVFATSNSNVGPLTVAFNGTAFGAQTAAVKSIKAEGPAGTIAKGQSLDTKDVTVTATLANGRTRVLDPSEYTLEGFDTAKLGKQDVTVKLAADPTITATVTVTVESDLARLYCSTAAASKYEPASSWASASLPSLTCDNDPATNWSNWGTGDTTPWLSYTFGGKAYQLGTLTFTVDKAKGEAAPKSFTVSYLPADAASDGTSGDASDAWVDASDAQVPAVTVDTAAGASTEVDLSNLPAVKGVRLNLTYADGNDYAKVAEVKIAERENATPAPSSNADLADLTVDGTTVPGFTAGTTEYDGSALLAGDATAYPKVEAKAADADKAKVTVEQADVDNGGKATVTVIAEDGTVKTYTVTFGELPKLAALDVDVTKTTYQEGDAFDPTGVKVTAVYKVGDKETARKFIASDDKDLAFTGFDSAASGTKTVTVSYRGVTATFDVTVVAKGSGSGEGTGDGGKGEGTDNGGKPESKPETKPSGKKPGAGVGAGSGAPGALSRTGASVAGVAGVVALLAAAAGAVTIARKRKA